MQASAWHVRSTFETAGGSNSVAGTDARNRNTEIRGKEYVIAICRGEEGQRPGGHTRRRSW
eukprot:1196588-Rhodomonas_salina.2